MARIQLRRGNKAALPSSSMLAGEPHFTMDRGTLHIALDATTLQPVVPAIGDLNTLASISGPDDFLIVHDASEASGVQGKKITFNNFKQALNIPEASTDELVAVVDGGQAGYIWGTDGTDGVLRMGDGLSWSKDAGNAFVTLGLDLNVSATFTGDGATTALDIATNAITYAMLSTSLQNDLDGKLETVSSDSSLSGDGTSGSPLSVDVVDGGTF